MAYAMTKQGSLDNCVTYEFICDTMEDMNAIENKYRTIGSTAIVINNGNGLQVYMSNSKKEWINLIANVNNNTSSTSDATSPTVDTGTVDNMILQE